VVPRLSRGTHLPMLRTPRCLVLVGLLLPALVASLPSRGYGYWGPNGVPLAQSERNEDAVLIAADGDGGAIVSYRVVRDSYDISAQRVLRSGAIAPGWPLNGAAVCTDPANQYEAHPAQDGTGGAYIGWSDRRHFAPGTWDQIYVHRLGADGTQAPGWPENGIRVAPAFGGQWHLDVAPDGAGGVYLVWEDYRRGVPYEDVQVDIYAQRILPSGARAPGWPETGIPVCTAPKSRSFPKLVSDGATGCFIVWADVRGADADIYAQHVLSDATIAPGWPADGLPVSTQRLHQTAHALVADGAGGFIVVWEDERATPPEQSSSLYTDVYAQRVSGDGTIAWLLDGAPVSRAAFLQQRLELVADGGGGAIIAWEDYRNVIVIGKNIYTQSDLYAQRMTASGAPAWTVDGIPLSRGAGFQLGPPAMAADGVGGALVVFETYAGGIFAQHVLSTGAIGPGWDPNGIGITAIPNVVQVYPVGVGDDAMGIITAWGDARYYETNLYDIYAQRIGASYPTSTLPSVRTHVEPRRIVLTWLFGAEPESRSASVERRTEHGDWTTIGTASYLGARRFEYEDRTVEAGRYAYRLKYATAERPEVSPEVWVTVPPQDALSLEGFSPNPAVGTPKVTFALGSDDRAELEVFDASGRSVLVRPVGSFGSGRHVVDLDRKLAPGMYWLRLTQGMRVQTGRGLVLR
jgi:hypothetical protein